MESRLRTNSLGEVLGTCFFLSTFESMTKRLTFLSNNFPGARTTLYVGEREQDELHKFALKLSLTYTPSMAGCYAVTLAQVGCL